jgi:hypothetical protein
MNPAAERLERAAMLAREVPLSDATLATVELIAKLATDVMLTSPSDQVAFAESLARLMRG